MTLRHAAIFAAFVGAIAMPGVAQAAPGDCLILGTPPELVCEPHDPPQEPVFYSICTPIDNSEVAPLLRKSCQTYVTETGAPYGDPQIYIYPPRERTQPPPSPAPTVEPVQDQAPEPESPVTPDAPDPAPAEDVETTTTTPPTTTEAPLTGTDAGMITEPAGTTTAATTTTPAPVYVPTTLGGPEEAGYFATNRVPLTIAAIALVFLIWAMLYKPKAARKGSHRK